jgi:hypothetical protein
MWYIPAHDNWRWSRLGTWGKANTFWYTNIGGGKERTS